MATVRKRRWTHKGQQNEAWVVRYNDAGGRQRLKTFKRKKDADAHCLLVENELEAGTHTPRSRSVTVAIAVEAMLEDAKARLSPESLQQCEINARCWLVPRLGGVLLVDLNADVVQDFCDELDGVASINSIIKTLYVLRRDEVS